MSEGPNKKLMLWGELVLQIYEDDERILGDSIFDWKAWKVEVYEHQVCSKCSFIWIVI